MVARKEAETVTSAAVTEKRLRSQTRKEKPEKERMKFLWAIRLVTLQRKSENNFSRNKIAHPISTTQFLRKLLYRNKCQSAKTALTHRTPRSLIPWGSRIYFRSVSSQCSTLRRKSVNYGILRKNRTLKEIQISGMEAPAQALMTI